MLQGRSKARKIKEAKLAIINVHVVYLIQCTLYNIQYVGYTRIMGYSYSRWGRAQSLGLGVADS